MALPTPQTLRVFEMMGDAEEQTILQYINNNQVHIDVNYVHEEQNTLLLQSVLFGYPKVMKKVLDLGATVNDEVIEMFDDYAFEPPAAQAKELMNALLNAGLPKQNILHTLCIVITGTHKELLKTLLEQPLDINYKQDGITPLHRLIMTFSEETEDTRGVFMEMLRTLMQKGANPNEVDGEGRTAIQLVNQLLADRNPKPILKILQAPAASAVPAAPAGTDSTAPNYKKLWADELMKSKSSPDIAKLEEYKNAGAIDVNANISSKDNPLSFRIVMKSDIKLIEALLKWGANPNLINNEIPIFWNIFKRSIKDIKLLLSLMINNGADVKLIAGNKTSLMYFMYYHQMLAFTQNHKETADILITNGVDIHYINNTDNTDVLDQALEYENKNAVAYLINKGLSLVVNGRTRFYFLMLRKLHYPSIMTDAANVLNILLSHDSNHNAYFKDYLDFALAYPSFYLIGNLYLKLKHRLILIGNEVFEDGSTPLIKAVQLYTKAPQQWVKIMIETMVEKGANIAYTDPTGKKAVDYTTDEDMKELLGEKPFKILWTGFSRSDIEFTNSIFHQTTHVSNLAVKNPEESLFSICPVCLKYIQHETTTCMYMTHSCLEQAGYQGYYHKKLWNAFSYEKEYDNLGRIIPKEQRKRVLEWCTNCGRICKGHKHYALQPIYKPGSKEIQIPILLGMGDYFATTCDKPGIGGGGIMEKLNRYRRFREMVHFLNEPEFINKITFENAVNQLVEAVWEAPLDPRRGLMNYIQKKGAFNRIVANETYMLPSELPPPPKYIYSVPVYPDAGNPDFLPIVYPNSTATIKNVQDHLSGDTENIVQFRHRMEDGKINKHNGPNQQIALDRLMDYIYSISSTQSSPDYGMCWQHTKESVQYIYDESKPPHKCTARLYPEELLHAINSATYGTDADSQAKKATHMVWYNAYKVGFENKFKKPIGVAPNNVANNRVNASNSKGNNSNLEGGTRKRRYRQRRRTMRRYRK
jgi:hypothetical protein